MGCVGSICTALPSDAMHRLTKHHPVPFHLLHPFRPVVEGRRHLEFLPPQHKLLQRVAEVLLIARLVVAAQIQFESNN